MPETKNLRSIERLKSRKKKQAMCGSEDSVSPAELSSGQQSFAAPSAVPHTEGADLLASQSGSGRPQSLLPVACSAAQVIEPTSTRKASL